MKYRYRNGFTLAELLIVVAIVGVLVAIGIPVFVAQMEKSKEATDVANMRSAKAAALADWLNEGSPETYSRYYDAAKGIMTNVIPEGYGKSSKDASGFAAYLNASGIPNTGAPRYVIVNIDSLGLASLTWGGNAAYLTAVSPYKNQTLVDLKSMPDADRIEADREVLKAIAKEILKQGWTKNDLKTNLSTCEPGGGYRIADYYQDKDGDFSDDSYVSKGITITCKPFFQEILKAIGYDGNTIGDPSTPSRSVESNLNSGSQDVRYDNSLFYSDAMATNKYRYDEDPTNYTVNHTRRIIFVSVNKTNSSGVITELTINAKAHQQANMYESDKNKFIIKVSLT